MEATGGEAANQTGRIRREVRTLDLLRRTADAQSDPAEQERIFNEYVAFTADINERGINVGGEALHGTDAATTVRVRDGETLATDGPFAETKEVLGGFYLIDVPDLDEAIAVAAKLPGSWYGSVEVRPVMTWDDDTTG